MFEVVAVYAVAAWAAIQVATSTFPYLGFPSWLITAVIILAIVGFPIALIIAWLQERNDQRLARHVVVLIALPALLVGAGIPYWRLKARGAVVRDADFNAATLTQVTSSQEVEAFPSFSSDGKRLAFTREAGGHRQLFTRDLASGEDKQITKDDFDHIQPTWSPNGRTLLYVRAREQSRALEPAEVFGVFTGADVWQLDLTSGRTQKLIDDAYNPVFSPDGKRIAYDASYGGPRRIWIADAAGRNPRQVTTDASEAVVHILPRWSTDGRLLAFQNIEKTKLDIRVVDVASGNINKITDDLVRDADPVWLPGRELLFSSPRGGGWNLWRVSVNPDGSAGGAPRQITTGAGEDLQATAAPDGSSIAFVTMNQNADLYELPVNGAGARTGQPIRVVGTTREDSRGSWSPDGKSIAFNSDRSGDMNVFVYSLGDQSTRQLTRGKGGDFQATWSPDGKTLAFFSSRAGNADIWTVDVATSALRQLTTDPALDVNPVYSPDGRTIAFQSDRGGRKEVWLMNADGTGQRQLTSTGVNDHFMLWSRDGSTLLYHGVGPQVMQVTVKTGESTLLREIKSGAHISFSPDGTRVMDVVDHKALWVTPLKDGAPTEVFAFPEPDARIDYPRWSPDGRFVLFDRLQPTGGDIWMLQLKRRP